MRNGILTRLLRRYALAEIGSLILCFVATNALYAQGGPSGDMPTPADVYSTWGVHNDAHNTDCATMSCIYPRKTGEPEDPQYPAYWTSHWLMFRVYKDFDRYPPPYDRRPPRQLIDGRDYETSKGVTYYDSTWKGSYAVGAMEEHYDKRCIPIFPFSNHYSCTFISLGDRAYFLTYADRPPWMPPVCRFSPHNHPPERDFVKHLPFAPSDGAQLNGSVLGYSFWIGADGKPYQIGVRPDQTSHQGILFGYAFYEKPSLDRINHETPAYRHPQSFYFSGVPYSKKVPLPAAPIVSQNYTDFAMTKPDPKATWAMVETLDYDALPQCQLFNPPVSARPGRVR